MKAIRCNRYGSPGDLDLDEVETPVPGENEVLVKVCAASVNPLDLQIGGGLARLWGGFSKPKDPRLGRDVAGRVEAVGSLITRFKPGDEVFGACAGAYAEYAVTKEKNLALKPANISFDEAAAAPVAAITALQGLRDKGRIQPGQKIVVNGASGGVGTYAVQIAKSYGAEVTAVCSPKNLDMARSLGADAVVDYTQADFTKSGQHYDLIFAVNGYHSIFDYRKALNPTGIFVLVGASKAHILPAVIQAGLLGPMLSKADGQWMGFMGIANINPKDLDFLCTLFESGKLKSVIDRRYPLDQVPAALIYLGEGHARGKVVITVAS